MIALIDYGMGNLRSVSKALEQVGAKVCVTRDPEQIKSAQKIVLPGVGAFPKCMENLAQYGFVELILQQIKIGKWFLGICLGLQLLFEEAEEFGPTPGLGLLAGKVPRFRLPAATYRIPHMGWNQVKKVGDPLLLRGIPDNSYFYFVHSYYVAPQDTSVISSMTDYGMAFCSSVEKENVLATQFHPEKSQALGLQVLKNFVTL